MQSQCPELDNFETNRITSEKLSGSSLLNIYKNLSKVYKWSNEQTHSYMLKEIDLEISLCIPITNHLSRVRDGDLVISDMYLDRTVLEAILRKAGLTKAVEIYVTPNGKGSGEIWKQLPRISAHTGDNYHADVKMPSEAGIKCQYVQDGEFTSHERFVGGDLALLMRAVRLRNPFEEHSSLWRVWDDQANFNIPILIIAASLLPSSNISFVHRDCIHLQKFHELIHQTNNQQFHCSRQALLSGGIRFRSYVKNVALGRSIVDIHGTGKSIHHYWNTEFGHDPDIIYISGEPVFGKRLVKRQATFLEMLNNSPMGSMAFFPRRIKHELEKSIVDAQLHAVEYAIKLASKLSLACPDLDLLHSLFDIASAQIDRDIYGHISQH